MCSSSCLNVMTSNPSKIISISVLWQQQTPLLLDLQLKRHVLHRLSQTSLACSNFDTCELTDFDVFFGRNVTDKVSNQKTLYYATSNNLCFCTAWQNGETRKLHFSLKCCISALPEFNQLLGFFNLFDSQLILTLLYNSLNLVINGFISGCWGMVQDKRSRERCRSWTVLHSSLVRCLLGFLFRKVMKKHRWDGKAKHHHLISYFISNTSAKNYRNRNRIVYVNITASQRLGRFLRHSVQGAA